jgi:hypothetical protein
MVEAINITAIPRAAGRYLDMNDFLSLVGREACPIAHVLRDASQWHAQMDQKFEGPECAYRWHQCCH